VTKSYFVKMRFYFSNWFYLIVEAKSGLDAHRKALKTLRAYNKNLGSFIEGCSRPVEAGESF
jgi:hypothetical protein